MNDLNEADAGRKQLFFVLTDLLKRFDKLCSDNGLEYFAFAGTLLGAVRHKSIIPWDDDVDITMPRKDYNILLELAEENTLEPPYSFLSPVTDKAYHKSFIRFTNVNTTEIPYKDAAFNYNHGIFIDIFPLDAVPDDEKEFAKLSKKLRMEINLLYFAGRYYGNVGTLGIKDIKKKIGYYLLIPLFGLKILTPSKVFGHLNKLASGWEGKNTKRIGTIITFFDNERFIYDRKDYEKSVLLPFEDILIKAPANYDRVLTKSYGDYMKPVKQSSEHGETIFDVNTPYKKYMEENSEELMAKFLKAKEKR